MTPARIRELRAAGVLDGSKADAARIALLDMYEVERKSAGIAAPRDASMARAIWFCLDPIMADTPKGRAMRWARAQARRRARP